jgi:hypothetical protein
MARSGDGDPPQVEPMKVVFESFLLRERLRPPKQSAMNSRLPKQTVSLREKLWNVKCSLLVETMSVDEGTIGTSRGKAHCKLPYMACQLSVFSASVNYGVAKIMRSSSEVVLRTTKHTMIYPGSGPSSEVIVIRLVV